MKKFLFLFLIFTATAVHCDELSDAIRESNVEKVRTVLNQGKISLAGKIKYLAIAQKSLLLRQQQLLLGSSTTRTLPSTLTMCGLATGLGAVYSTFFLKNLFGYESGYEFGFWLALKAAAKVAIGIGGTTAATHWYRKKIKQLEDAYDNAAIIYELIYDTANRDNKITS